VPTKKRLGTFGAGGFHEYCEYFAIVVAHSKQFAGLV
jgi:hypothetical protein